MREQDSATVAEELKRASKDGKITCLAAFEVADRLGVSKRLVGQVADEERIKIVVCQLGCF